MPMQQLTPTTLRPLFAVVALVSVLGFLPSLLAGDYIVDRWDTDKGLPQGSVIAMAQTRDGYLWVGTRNGLARFDGNRFEVFNQWNTPGLNDNTIVHLFADSGGGLWVGTESGGVSWIKNGRVTNTGFGAGTSSGQLASACEDNTGAVWLYTLDGRLARFHGGYSEKTWLVNAGRANWRAVAADAAGQVWIGSKSNLNQVISNPNGVSSDLLLKNHSLGLDYLIASREGGIWQLVNGRILKVQTNGIERDLGAYPWDTALVKSVCEDQQGNLIVGTDNNGVFWFDAAGKASRLTTVEGLSHNTALSLCVDHEGNLWVGTDGGGLNRVKRNTFSLAPAGRTWVVQSVSADATGGLWMGFNGWGTTHWRERGETWEDYGSSEGLFGFGLDRKPNFSCVMVDHEQRVWVGTRDVGLFEFVTGHFQPVREQRLFGRNIAALHQDRSGTIWVGTDAGLASWNGREWNFFGRRDGLPGNNVTAIADDADGNLWVGTERGGLSRLRNGQFTLLRSTNGLPGQNISCLLADSEGVLWVGTGDGLVRFQSGSWFRFTKKEGLASNSIHYFIEDDQGNLWIGSNAGLTRVAKKALGDFASGRTKLLVSRIYTTDDGLPTSECTGGSQPAACRTRDGQLWFPTIRGLVSVNPAQLTPNTNPPPVIIESVLVDDEEQNTNSLGLAVRNLIIPAGRERLDISFTSLNLAAPERARFRYQMEGYESTPVEAKGSRTAHYSKLPPDNYRFRVTACNEDSVWNLNGVLLEITVLPPFWRTWWFIAVATVCVLGAVAGTVHFISTQKLQRQLAVLRQQEALERERARIARDLHDQLGANLTQVALLGELAEEDKHSPAEIETHAKQISQTARETTRALDEIVWAANPKNDTLEGLVNYVCKYAQDYLQIAGLRYRLDVPSELPATTVPPDLRHNVFLAFKESINNVVKHAKATEVAIRLKLDDRTFTLEIEDNGRGPAEADSKTGRNGLRNMRKRMEDVGGTFTFEPAPERGTKVRLVAPVGKQSV